MYVCVGRGLDLEKVERLAAVFALVWLVRHQRGKSQVNIFYANWVAHSLG